MYCKQTSSIKNITIYIIFDKNGCLTHVILENSPKIVIYWATKNAYLLDVIEHAKRHISGLVTTILTHWVHYPRLNTSKSHLKLFLTNMQVLKMCNNLMEMCTTVQHLKQRNIIYHAIFNLICTLNKCVLIEKLSIAIDFLTPTKTPEQHSFETLD